MDDKNTTYKSREELEKELEELRYQLWEANETIEAIRNGQVDALVVAGEAGHQLYTLKSADQTYRVFIENMTEGAVTINPKGIILYSNSQFARMVNQPLNEVIGKAFKSFIKLELQDEFEKLFTSGWKADCKGELMINAGEKFTPVLLSLTTLELDEGLSLSIILTDLTEQKETQETLRENNSMLATMNQQLESSNHDLQQFASVASHDLQEPLRKIQIFSNLLKERTSGILNEEKKYIDKIIESSARMKTLIVDILNYSRLSAKDSLFEEIDLEDMIRELLEDFELIINDKNAIIELGDLHCVVVNRGQIRQVFQNIISNALKFSRPGVTPRITIKSKRIAEKSFDAPEAANGAYCCISIRDNGIGFDDKYARNIFALFERLNSKDKYEGTGIGLAIAKKIIDKHKGLIAAHSKEGEGAEFMIILPINNASK